MTINEFEAQLKEMDANWRIVPHPTNQDMAGVYYLNRYQFAVPNGEIKEEPDPSYRNLDGRQHRSASEARAIAAKYLHDLANDPEFRAMEEEVI